MIIMEQSDLKRVCKYALFESGRRGERAICSCEERRKTGTYHCEGMRYIPTGHSGDDTVIDLEKMVSCKYRAL
jgi:hypothetical protein